MIDLSEYYSGGYFLIRAHKPDWPQLQTDLLPEKLLSLSRCICPRVEVAWGWIPGDREAALRFGILEDKLDEFVEWCGHTSDIDHLSMFHSVEAAQRFVQRFLPNTSNLYLIGAGLYQALEPADWNGAKAALGDIDLQTNLLLQPNPASFRTYGVEGQIGQRLLLADGGTPLGFEVICFAYNDFADSWYCNFTAEDLVTMLGIRPGKHGLIERREEAQRVNDWIAEDPTHRGEPLPYAYWLLVSYPLTN